MRIAVSVDQDQGLTSVVSHHFGRCPYYLLADIEGKNVKDVTIVANPFFQRHEPGQVPKFIHEQGANVMLSGGMGYRAINFFQQLDIQVATGAQGTVGETVQLFLDGKLNEAAPCSDSVAHQQDGHHHH